MLKVFGSNSFAVLTVRAFFLIYNYLFFLSFKFLS